MRSGRRTADHTVSRSASLIFMHTSQIAILVQEGHPVLHTKGVTCNLCNVSTL